MKYKYGIMEDLVICETDQWDSRIEASFTAKGWSHYCGRQEGEPMVLYKPAKQVLQAVLDKLNKQES